MTLLGGLIALVILAGVTVMQAIAPAPVPGVCIYYSDATYTEVVGARGTGCCGHVINSGIVTPFRRCERIYCPDVICPN
jgi:hypothetical protein